MTGAFGPPSLEVLVDAAARGDRRALGRLVSVVERDGDDAERLERLVHPRSGAAHVVGITGAPGAGKSTLTGALAACAARAGRRVGVLAVDPSSPLSGGAILGDRIRMDDVVEEVRDRLFIRSMATRGQRGGLALAVPGAVRVLDACGIELVIVETVGVGQVEIDVVGGSDTAVVVVNPGWGDAIQANKAGILELADVLVVNKADRPGVDDAVRDLEHMLDLGPSGRHGPAQERWRPPVLRTVATGGDGVADLFGALVEHRSHLERTGELGRRRADRLVGEVRARARRRLDAALDRAMAASSAVLDDVNHRRVSPTEAARAIVDGVVERAR
jgi:LAO/AO transport system kinase